MRLCASILVFGLFTACAATVPEGRFACEGDDDCPDEMVCRTDVQRCYATRDEVAEDADERPDAGP